MKPSLTKHRLIYSALLGSVLLTGQAAYASVTYNGSAALTFTLNTITNLNPAHPTDLSGLGILGSFQQATDPAFFYIVTSGDGAVSANNPDVAGIPVAVGNPFSQSFAVSGSALNGTTDSHHTGWFKLDFNNTGSDSYSIDLSLAYQLNAEANELFANTSVALDYGYSGNTFVGSDLVEATTLAGFPYDTHSQPGSSGLTFTLAAGASESFYADVVVAGNLQSSSPVPLPAAVWCFASGLLGVFGVGMKKRKITRI